MPRIESVPPSRYTVYLRRAREFHQQMLVAESSGAWNAVGLLSVHSTISACDALTVAKSGNRWSGQDHAEAVGLVHSSAPDAPPATLRQVEQVIAAKNRVEYESREFTKAEAAEMSKRASRVLEWVLTQLRTEPEPPE